MRVCVCVCLFDNHYEYNTDFNDWCASCTRNDCNFNQFWFLFWINRNAIHFWCRSIFFHWGWTLWQIWACNLSHNNWFSVSIPMYERIKEKIYNTNLLNQYAKMWVCVWKINADRFHGKLLSDYNTFLRVATEWKSAQQNFAQSIFKKKWKRKRKQTTMQWKEGKDFEWLKMKSSWISLCK